MDEYPSVGAWSLISKEAHALIDAWMSVDRLTDTEDTFARACHHYHAAREQDALVYDGLITTGMRNDGSGEYEAYVGVDSRLALAAKFSRRAEEIATVLYISSVEVASSINSPPSTKCRECGQERHRIGSRVVEYATLRMQPGSSKYIAEVFKDHYKSRSRYLHAGVVLVDQTYTGTTIPLLDPSSDSGVIQRTSVKLLLMREWVGFMLRRQLKEMVGTLCLLPKT